jgi:hypothetical protein
MDQQHVTALQEIDSAYFSRQQVPLEGRSGRSRTTTITRRCQEIADRGHDPQTTQGSNKIVTMDARNSEGMIPTRPMAKLRWSAKCTRVCSKCPMGEDQMLPSSFLHTLAPNVRPPRPSFFPPIYNELGPPWVAFPPPLSSSPQPPPSTPSVPNL